MDYTDSIVKYTFSILKKNEIWRKKSIGIIFLVVGGEGVVGNNGPVCTPGKGLVLRRLISLRHLIISGGGRPRFGLK